ncbi:hypothetical protein [Kordiimonas pumila]|uniref:Uncharacterized protein n=1 Tax=Kordiimonas pumila TaxID=2161677 RepID=A0ABV7D3E1_9PROT|nr:hypothetical protein [Kordiimonas pumila]
MTDTVPIETPVLSAKQAKTIIQFLQRTQLQGAEMPAYVDAFNALSAIAASEGAGQSAVSV